jgi:hypothetical protein
MKKLAIISALALSGILVISCGDNKTPGSNYMPDMAYSRAYESYETDEQLTAIGVHYNRRPVAGTVGRGEELPYHLANDSAGYAMSAGIKKPSPKVERGRNG